MIRTLVHILGLAVVLSCSASKDLPITRTAIERVDDVDKGILFLTFQFKRIEGASTITDLNAKLVKGHVKDHTFEDGELMCTIHDGQVKRIYFFDDPLHLHIENYHKSGETINAGDVHLEEGYHTIRFPYEGFPLSIKIETLDKTTLAKYLVQ